MSVPCVLAGGNYPAMGLSVLSLSNWWKLTASGTESSPSGCSHASQESVSAGSAASIFPATCLQVDAMVITVPRRAQ